jgi:hypothetical protein
MEIVVELVVTTKGVTNHVKLDQLDVGQRSMVPVVNEFHDVIPGELLGMPPDRDIKFIINLMPGTMPIYKSPDRIATP